MNARCLSLAAALLLACALHVPAAQAPPAGAESVSPTVKTPFTVPPDAASKKQLVQQIQAYMALPPAQVHAHPAAADFPGLASAGSPRVTRQVSVHAPGMHSPARAPYANAGECWQSTGLYANAGETVTVTPQAPLPAGMTLEIRIGCHTDSLFGRAITQWKRFPIISRAFTLTQQQPLPIASAFGGPIMIAVKFARRADGVAPADLNLGLSFAGAVEAPYFELGKTPLADWQKLRAAPAPWGELVGRRMILHFPSDQIRAMDDPTALLEWWDKVVEAEDGLIGWTGRTAQERVVPDRQISAGGMHSGYPFMCQYYAVRDITDLNRLRSGGDFIWGFFHELGHNHQGPDWSFPSETEVKVNLFSLYCMEHIIGKPRGTGHASIDGPKMLACLDRRFATPPVTGPFEQLAPFIVLIHKYGWEPVQKTLASYQAQPLAAGTPEEQRRIEFVRRYSQNARADLSGFFKKMGYPCPDALSAELKSLPAFDLEAWRKEFTPAQP